MQDTTNAKLKRDAGLGGTLSIAPLWIYLIQEISTVAGMIAAVCGAILGVHAVYRLWRRSRKPSARHES